MPPARPSRRPAPVTAGADLVVLDESFAALDPESLDLALRCVLERGPALLVIAHP